jgi:hypothetical protein
LRFYTPEFYAALGGMSLDEQVESVMKVSTDYGQHLEEIRPHVPPPIGRLIDLGSFHDAIVRQLQRSPGYVAVDIEGDLPQYDSRYYRRQQLRIQYQANFFTLSGFDLENPAFAVEVSLAAVEGATWLYDEYSPTSDTGWVRHEIFLLTRGGPGVLVNIEFDACSVASLR